MQAKRQRRGAGKSSLLRRLRGPRVVAGSAAVALAVTGTGLALAETYSFGTAQVAQTTSKGMVIPTASS